VIVLHSVASVNENTNDRKTEMKLKTKIIKCSFYGCVDLMIMAQLNYAESLRRPKGNSLEMDEAAFNAT